MALLPYLDPPEQSVEMISQFGGYNHRISINENEFYDMRNMSAKDYPLVAVREKRATVESGIMSNISNTLGIIAKEKLIVPYLSQGNIGVTVAADVAAAELEVPAVKIDGEWYTEIPLSEASNNMFMPSFCEASARLDFGTYYYLLQHESNNAWYRSFKEYTRPVYYEEEQRGVFLIKWPHEKIESGSKFYEGLGWLRRQYKDTDFQGKTEIELEINANNLLKDEVFCNSLKEDMVVYVGNDVEGVNQQRAYIKNIGELDEKGVRKVTIYWEGEWKGGTLQKGSSLKTPLTLLIEEEIPTRNLVDYIRTEVEVNAANAAAVHALLGQKVTWGNEEFNISQVKTDGEQFSVFVDRPHGAISQGTTAYGDRLFLAEIDPKTGAAVTTNVCAASTGRRHFIEMGGNLVIFPEKVVVNTLNKNLDGEFNDVQLLEFTNVLKGTYASRLCDINGNFYDSGTVSNTAPTEPEEGHAWIDTSEEPPILKVWSSQTSQWAATQPYCQLYSSSISEAWQEGDAIEIEFNSEEAGKHLRPQKKQKYFVISATGEDEENEGIRYIRFPVAISTYEEVQATTNDMVTLKRTVPDMDFVIECKNRIWGCKYGMVDGEMINELFACKLGDPKNWHHFTNTSIDSYYVTMGADGEFTGAISYLDNPVFFRENCMHRVLGDYPAAFGLKKLECHGVEKGSENGITVMNDVLFYKSPVGIMAYTGATPVNVSECFGNEKYKNAVSCSLGNKMYFCLQNSKGESHLFAFDDGTKLWHKEDGLACKDFAVFEGEIYALTEDDRIISMSGMNGTTEDDFEWSLTSGNIGYSTPFRKRISKLNMRLLMELDARASISIQYDSSGYWQHISNIRPSGKVRSMAVPIFPHRCDHFALKIQGKGDCKILSITKYMEEGSDVD